MIQVDIYTIKSSLVLGKTGENLEKIIALLSKKTGKKVSVDVREIKN
jgi:small subunit ribosomal protein S3